MDYKRDGKKFINAYYDLKQYWASQLPKEEINKLNFDEGFAQWLIENRADAVLSDILNSHDLNFAEFYIKSDAAAGLKGGITVSKPGVGFIQEFATKGEYRILDKYYNPVSEDVLNKLGLQPIYDNLMDAKIAFDTYKASVGNTTPFNYGGVPLSNGATLTHKETGQKFIVNVPNIEDIEIGNNLTVIPTDEGVFESISIPESQINEYSLTIEEVLGLPMERESLPKMDVLQPIKVIPSRTGQFDFADISRSYERFGKILNVLTADEISNVEIVITLNENGGAKLRPFTRDKKQNPYIERFSNKYNIGIKIPDKAIGKVQDLFADGNLKNIYSDGVIGYIFNTNLAFKDTAGNEIDPMTMTMDQYKAFLMLMKAAMKKLKTTLQYFKQ